METEFDMSSFSLEPYAKNRETWAITPRMIGELLIVLYVAMQTYDEIKEIKAAGICNHFLGTGGFWNVVDTLRLTMFITSILGYITIIFDSTAWNLVLPLPANQIYVDFADLEESFDRYVMTCSIAIVLCLLSVMKYIRHSQSYGLLIITLAQAGPEIFRFMVRMCKSVTSTFVVEQCAIGCCCVAWTFAGDVLDREADLRGDGSSHVRQHFGGIQHYVTFVPDAHDGAVISLIFLSLTYLTFLHRLDNHCAVQKSFLEIGSI